ncbi:MAG: hypothetical protein ACREBY_18935, partial [Polaromonas sp.]
MAVGALVFCLPARAVTVSDCSFTNPGANRFLSWNSTTSDCDIAGTTTAFVLSGSPPSLSLTARTIGAVSYDGTANIVPQTIQTIDAAGDTTTFPLLNTAATGSLQPVTDPGLSYNATTDALTATTFSGALSGNATTATALAANGTNCSAGNYPLGVDASGNSESCTSSSSGTLPLSSLTAAT